MKPHITKTISLLAASVGVMLALGVLGTAHATNLIINGDFESPVVPVGSFTDFAAGSSLLTGWTVTGASGGVSVVSGNFSQNGVAFTPQNGSQWLDLTGDGTNSNEGVAQTVATTVGNEYQLSYYVGNTTGGSIFGTTSTVNVLMNGATVQTSMNSTANTIGQSWQQFTYTFTATNMSTLLGFQNADPINDNSNGLDNIVLTDLGPSVSAVPEPHTWAILLAGLGFMSFISWCKNKEHILDFA